MSIESVLGMFTNVPIDWAILAMSVIFLAFDIVRSGAKRVAILALALPATVLLISALSSDAVLGPISKQFAAPLLQAVLFAVIFVVMYVLVGRLGISYGGESGQPVQALIGGLAATVILVCIWVMTPALQSVWNFGPQVQAIFGEGYRFWWILGSFSALAFIRR